MAKRLFRKFVPAPERLRWLGPLAHRPDLWHMNRHSASRAVAVGVFWGLIPIPLQTIPTILFAILFRANVALAWGVTWITYPFAFVLFPYLAYTLGRVVLRRPPMDVQFTFRWAFAHFWDIGLPWYLGSAILAGACAVLSYFGFQIFWSGYVRRRWMRRKHRRFPLAVKVLDLEHVG